MAPAAAAASEDCFFHTPRTSASAAVKQVFVFGG